MTVMRVCLVLIAATFVTAVVAPVPALSADPSQPVILELKGPVGEETRYRSELDFSLEAEINDPSGGMSVTVKPRLSGWLTTSEKISAVSAEGDLTTGGRLEAFDVKFDLGNLHLRAAVDPAGGGVRQLIRLPDIPISTVVSKRGRVVALQGLEKLPIPPLPGPQGQKIDLPGMISKLIGEFSQPILPDGPVKVGDTWETSLTVDVGEMLKTMGLPIPPEQAQELGDLAIPMTTTYTFVGYETTDGTQTAAIRGESPWRLEMPVSGGRANGGRLTESGNTVLTMFLAPETGKVVRQSAVVTLEMVMQGEAGVLVRTSMRGTIEQKLVK